AQARGEELRPGGRSFSATMQGRLRRRSDIASLGLVLKDEACALARGQSGFWDEFAILEMASFRLDSPSSAMASGLSLYGESEPPPLPDPPLPEPPFPEPLLSDPSSPESLLPESLLPESLLPDSSLPDPALSADEGSSASSSVSPFPFPALASSASSSSPS